MDERQTMDRILALLIEKRERAHVAARFQKQAERFKREFGNIASPDNAYGVRVTATPKSPDGFSCMESVLGSPPRLVAGLRTPVVRVTREYTFDRPPTPLANVITAQDFTPNWRPRLRAARVEDPDQPTDKRYLFRYLEIHCDGVIEYGFVDNCKRTLAPEKKRYLLYVDYVISQVAVVAGWVDSLRKFAGATCAEYAIEVAISVQGQPVLVRPWGADFGGSHYERFNGGELAGETQLVLGRRYPFTIPGGRDALSPALLSRVEMDLCHAAGFQYLDGHSLTLTSTAEGEE